MIEYAVMVVAPVAGWLAKKQLDVNKQVASNTSAITELKEDVTHTRDRVDAIYDHLISKKQGDRS